MRIYPMDVEVENPSQNEFPKITLKFLSPDKFDYRKFIGSNWDMDFAPQNVLVKCSACGQWGARFCECRYCGYPID